MMTTLLQLADGIAWEAGLKVNGAAIGFGRSTGRSARADVIETRGVAGFLQSHAEVEEVHKNLDMALRLHIAAHHAEAHHGLTVFGNKCGNDRVERALAGGI